MAEEGMALELPFDQYQRYNLVREIVGVIRSHAQPERLRLLDVGGYFRTRNGEEILPLTFFCPGDEITVVDLNYTPHPHFVQADGRALPFLPSSFDVVVACDTLEHVTPDSREQFVKEMLSASRWFILIAGPFARQDVMLAEAIVLQYTWLLGLDHPPLRDHRRKGLPKAEELRSLLKAQGVSFFEFPSGYLLDWLLLMMLKQNLLPLPGSEDLHRLFDRFQNLNFCDTDARTPAYRRVFIICKDRQDPIMDELRRRYELRRPKEDAGEKRRNLITLVTGLLAIMRARAFTGPRKVGLPPVEERHRADLKHVLAALKGGSRVDR